MALVLWQAPLPEADAAERIRSFVDRGGQVIFFPPANPDSTEFIGVQLATWVEAPEEISVETWRGDQDLLAHTQSGAALPVGELHMRRYCRFEWRVHPLATLHGGAPLLVADSDRSRRRLFLLRPRPRRAIRRWRPTASCFTWSFSGHWQRARQCWATRDSSPRANFRCEGRRTLETSCRPDRRPFRPNIPPKPGYMPNGDRLLAVNRSDAEDLAPVLADDRRRSCSAG